MHAALPEVVPKTHSIWQGPQEQGLAALCPCLGISINVNACKMEDMLQTHCKQNFI